MKTRRPETIRLATKPPAGCPVIVGFGDVNVQAFTRDPAFAAVIIVDALVDVCLGPKRYAGQSAAGSAATGGAAGTVASVNTRTPATIHRISNPPQAKRYPLTEMGT